MKRASILAVVLALALSLAACGTRDNGSTSNGIAGTAGSTQDGAGGSGIAGTDGNGTNGESAAGRSTSSAARGNDTLGDDLADGARGVVRDVERGVDDLLDTAPRTTTGAKTTSFQRMLDNARVHDMDGVLTDGENSRW